MLVLLYTLDCLHFDEYVMIFFYAFKWQLTFEYQIYERRKQKAIFTLI